MDVFFKVCALALVICVLYQMMSGCNREIGLLLMIFGCTVVVVLAVSYMEPVFDFIRKLQNISGMNSEMFSIILKCTGIGLLAEITTLSCNDMGDASLGKALQILATVLILWLSLPMFDALLDLISEILGGL